MTFDGRYVEARWNDLVVASTALARAHARLLHAEPADERLRILRRELRGEHPSVALSYLRSFSEEALELVPEVMWHATSLGLAQSVRDALKWIPPDRLFPRLMELLPGLLDEADADTDSYDYYSCYAEVLAHAQSWKALRMLVDRAMTSADEDVVEVGETFTAMYGPLLESLTGD